MTFMYRSILLGVFLVGSVMAGLGNYNSPDSIPVFQMGEIVVVAERLPMITTSSIYEIKTADIQRLDIHQPVEALQFKPGIHVSKTAKNEVVFNLRGFEQRQISVFLDGVPVSLPYDGLIDLSQISGDQLETIRVSKGTVSPLYGINTLGGSVNIISRKSAFSKPLSLRIEAGHQGRFFGSFAYHQTYHKLDFTVHTNYTRADDFILPHGFQETPSENGNRRDNSDYENLSAGVKLHYTISPLHQVALNISRIDNSYNIPPLTKTRFVRYWRFPKWEKTIYSLTSKHLFCRSFILRSVLFQDSYYNMLKSYDDYTYSTQDMKYAWNSEYDDYSRGIFLYPSFHYWDRGSTNFIFTFKQDVHREQFRNSGFESYETSAFIAGIEQDIRIRDRYSFIVGGDLNYLKPVAAKNYDLRDPILLVNGQVAGEFRVYPGTTIHASLAKRSRFPTLKELYSERFGRTLPNPELRAEHTINTELGIRRNIASGHLQVTGFYNTLNDLIMLRQIGEGEEQLQNTGTAVIRGIELETRYSSGQYSITGNYTGIDARNISLHRPSAHLPNRPGHSFSMIAGFPLYKALSGIVEACHVADQWYEHPDEITWKRFDDYTVINIRMNYQIHTGSSWYFRVNNVTDALYENDFGVPMPGREMVSGIRIAM